MNFGRGRSREEPEINLIPMIDVLLVIIIFLMLTTTYSRFAGLEINLPTADATASNDKLVEVNVAVTATGEVVINKRPVNGAGIPAIAAAMQAVVPAGWWQAAQSAGEWTLVSCTVSPGFRFEGFELAPPGWELGA